MGEEDPNGDEINLTAARPAWRHESIRKITPVESHGSAMTSWSRLDPAGPWVESEIMVGADAAGVRPITTSGETTWIVYDEVQRIDEVGPQTPDARSLEATLSNGATIALLIPDVVLDPLMTALTASRGGASSDPNSGSTEAEPAESDRMKQRKVLLGAIAAAALLAILGVTTALALGGGGDGDTASVTDIASAERPTTTATTSTTATTTTTMPPTTMPPTTTIPVFAVSGSLAVEAGIARSNVWTPQTGIFTNEDNPVCISDDGYADVAVGTSVTVYDGSSNVLGTGSIESVEWTNLTENRYPGTPGSPEYGIEGTPSQVQVTGECLYRFTVGGLPPSEFYAIEVGRRGKLNYSASDLESKGWVVQLQLS